MGKTKTKKVKVQKNATESPEALETAGANVTTPEVTYENKTTVATKRKTAPLVVATTIGAPRTMDAEDLAASKAILALNSAEYLLRLVLIIYSYCLFMFRSNKFCLILPCFLSSFRQPLHYMFP